MPYTFRASEPGHADIHRGNTEHTQDCSVRRRGIGRVGVRRGACRSLDSARHRNDQCSTFTGTLAETPALTNNPSVKAIKIKGAGAASSCSGAETGGKAPITAATFKMTGSLPIGSSCGSLVTPTFGPTKIQVKWQGLNPSNKLMTVGADNTTLASAALDINTLSLVVTTAPLLKDVHGADAHVEHSPRRWRCEPSHPVRHGHQLADVRSRQPWVDLDALSDTHRN